jgi:threonine aldolase
LHKTIDLRSDTVTRPTPEMRMMMANAEVGDDVFDDDPTVHRLQEKAAALLGKDSALFVPTGTMGNAVAFLTHTRAGDEVLLDAKAHSMCYEVGMPGAIAHVVTRTFHSVRGVPDVADVISQIGKADLHRPGTSLLVLENTHNLAGGAIIPLQTLQALFREAGRRGVRVHMDGARLFNAVVGSGTPVAEIASAANSVTFCLSKGLGCPVGSVLCGDREFIDRARRNRKMLGGGMRQTGILAAAGIYALDHHIERLEIDHRNAQQLAAAIEGVPGIHVSLADVQTNMIYFSTDFSAGDFARRLEAEKHVRAIAMGPQLIRMVTHLDVDSEDMLVAAAAIRETATAMAV